MAEITKADITRIAKVLGASKVSEGKESFRMKISGEDAGASLSLEIYPEVLLGKTRGALITVYTPMAHLQLHNCTGFVISEELGEVTFISEIAEKISGMVVERSGFCSEYASVNRDLISGDFTKLGVEVMLSGVAMSLAEEALQGPGQSDTDNE